MGDGVLTVVDLSFAAAFEEDLILNKPQNGNHHHCNK
jgi:hypothetical protein